MSILRVDHDAPGGTGLKLTTEPPCDELAVVLRARHEMWFFGRKYLELHYFIERLAEASLRRERARGAPAPMSQTSARPSAFGMKALIASWRTRRVEPRTQGLFIREHLVEPGGCLWPSKRMGLQAGEQGCLLGALGARRDASHPCLPGSGGVEHGDVA